MFSSRKITQCDQIELIWDDRVVFLLSLSPEEGTAGELQGSVSEDTVLITVRAEKEAREPCFGPQAYFDSREGIVYHLDIPETERFLAVYQHKDCVEGAGVLCGTAVETAERGAFGGAGFFKEPGVSHGRNTERRLVSQP